MTNKLKERFNLGTEEYNVADEFDLDHRPEDYVAFRIDQQLRPSNAMIDFWMSNGDRRAIEYNHLYDVEYKRSEGFVLTFSEHQITIEGRRLDDLYSALKRHRIVFVWEASKQEAAMAAPDDSVVTGIHIQLRRDIEASQA